MRKPKNSNKIILDLCGGSGAWSAPYSAAGYDVKIVTLPDNDIRTYSPPANVYGVLAAPPCQEFSIAKGAQQRDFKKGLKIVNRCLQIIQEARLANKLRFWAMENPVGFLRQFIGKPLFTFYYWEFGDDIKKRTDLWGYFAPPRKTHTKPGAHCVDSIKHVSGDRSYKEQTAWREKTRPGFARAFFKANP